MDKITNDKLDKVLEKINHELKVGGTQFGHILYILKDLLIALKEK